MLKAYEFLDQSSCSSSSQEMTCSSATSEESDRSRIPDLEQFLIGLEGVFQNTDSALSATDSFHLFQDDNNFSHVNQRFQQAIFVTGRPNYDFPTGTTSVSPLLSEQPYNSFVGWQESNNLSEVIDSHQSCDFYQKNLFNLENNTLLANSLCNQTPFSSPETGSKPKRRRKQTTKQRKDANVRERTRMFNLNHAYDALKKCVPTFSYEKRISRMDTLRLAIGYIEFMTDLLDEETSQKPNQAKSKRCRLIDLSSFSLGHHSQFGNHSDVST